MSIEVTQYATWTCDICGHTEDIPGLGGPTINIPEEPPKGWLFVKTQIYNETKAGWFFRGIIVDNNPDCISAAFARIVDAVDEWNVVQSPNPPHPSSGGDEG